MCYDIIIYVELFYLFQDIQNQADDFRRQILDITTDIEREINDVRCMRGFTILLLCVTQPSDS